MRIYDEIDTVPVNHMYFDDSITTYRSLKLANICRATQNQDMETLTPIDVHNMIMGIAVVGVYSGPRILERTKVLSLAGVTGFNQLEGQTLAVVGGLITMPSARGYGFGTMAVQALLNNAGNPMAQQLLGHEGFIAACNKNSTGIFDKQGFKKLSIRADKQLMVKLF